MSLLQAFLLGVLQGATEFLPVSSAGHLVLFQHLLGLKEPLLAFDISTHVGTLVAVLIYFFRDIIPNFLKHALLDRFRPKDLHQNNPADRQQNDTDRNTKRHPL